MKCIFCSGPVNEQIVKAEVTSGQDHILVPVKAEVCENCHERYYPSGTIDYLQSVKKEMAKTFKKNRSAYKEVGRIYKADSTLQSR